MIPTGDTRLQRDSTSIPPRPGKFGTAQGHIMRAFGRRPKKVAPEVTATGSYMGRGIAWCLMGTCKVPGGGLG